MPEEKNSWKEHRIDVWKSLKSMAKVVTNHEDRIKDGELWRARKDGSLKAITIIASVVFALVGIAIALYKLFG